MRQKTSKRVSNKPQHRTALRAVCSLLLSALLILTASCSGERTTVYTHYISLPERVWTDSAEYFFSFPLRDTLARYQIRGSARLSDSYPYSTLRIGVVCEYPDRHFDQFVYDIDLTSDHSRRQKKTSGYIISEVFFVVDSLLRIPSPGTYTYSFRHLLTDTVLPGVIELGLQVERLPEGSYPD